MQLLSKEFTQLISVGYMYVHHYYI